MHFFPLDYKGDICLLQNIGAEQRHIRLNLGAFPLSPLLNENNDSTDFAALLSQD